MIAESMKMLLTATVTERAMTGSKAHWASFAEADFWTASLIHCESLCLKYRRS